MSDFKFACPGCGQRIAASDEYTGRQINCPACQALIVVPSNPAATAAPPAIPSIAIKAPPGMPPPPAPPKASRLSVSSAGAPPGHSSIPVPTPEQQGSAGYRTRMANKPGKNYAGPIVGAVAVVLIGVAAVWNWGWIKEKLSSSSGPSEAEVAAAAAAAAKTNTPPPPPPQQPVTAPEIMKRVADVYRHMPSFSCTGNMIADVDTSALSSAAARKPAQKASSELILKMSKPNSFSINMTLPSQQGETTLAGWSTGSGDHLVANNRPVQVTSREDLFSRFQGDMPVGVGDIVRLFMDDKTRGLATSGMVWTLSDDPDIDKEVDGEPCYVLTAPLTFQNILVWVSQKSFLIPQIQVKLGVLADADDDTLKATLTAQNKGVEPTLAKFNSAKKQAKIKGSYTDSFANIQTNLTIAAADFVPAGFGPNGMPTNSVPGPGGQNMPGGRATSIVNGGNGYGPGGGGGGFGGGPGGGGRGGGRGGR
jgi:DNA-directed RNA polymerase subunit RPC12/RpoP